MGSDIFLRLLFVMIATCCVFGSSSQAYKFYVGGKHGWVVKPSEEYNKWAERNRFQVNDTLYFKYKKGSDSVLVVKKEDYDSCNTKNPIKKMDDGDSSFQLDKSGPFYFISGEVDHCRKGQRIIVLVMAMRPKHQSPPPPASAPPSAAPVPSPAAHSPPAGSPGAAEPSEEPSSSSAPAPSPSENSNHSGSTRVGGSVNVAVGVGVTIGAILMIFAGVV
ncbi:hypothetical protein L6164_022361 [Bauhinia variegata]|uniref:Uncharacterized protein n=1 Tax=Bauhinia variegata TaxID=167791 RepID=A0ACB9MGA3_BAUVA|nr:hypothetical protein L6164_022361 [Bauhinia variegata]